MQTTDECIQEFKARREALEALQETRRKQGITDFLLDRYPQGCGHDSIEELCGTLDRITLLYSRLVFRELGESGHYKVLAEEAEDGIILLNEIRDYLRRAAPAKKARPGVEARRGAEAPECETDLFQFDHTNP